VGIGVGAMGAEVATVAMVAGTDAGAETDALTEEGEDITAPTAAAGAGGIGVDTDDLRAGRSGVWLTMVHFAPGVRLLT